VDQFVVGENGQLYHYWLNTSPHLESWGGSWSGVSGINASPPAAVSWGSPRLDVFLVGQNGRLYHYWQAGGSVYYLEMVPAADTTFPANSYIAATTWGSGRLDAFLVGQNGHLYHYWQDHTGSFSWENLGGAFLHSAPAAVTWGYPRIDVFIPGPDETLTHFWQQNTPFQAETILPGYDWRGNDPPTVVSWGPGRLDLFLFDSGSHGSQFYHVWEQDNSAFQVEPLPIFIPGKGGIRSARAVNWGPGRLDIFVIAGDGYTVRTLEHLWYPDGNAFGSEVIDNNIMPYSTVAATTWPGRLDVFVGYGATESSPMHHFWQAKPVLKAPKHS
jgi:hypothetical protein